MRVCSSGHPDRLPTGASVDMSNKLPRQYIWPGDDLNRIPDWVYTDSWVHEREVERIFHGRTWSYVGRDREPRRFHPEQCRADPVVVTRDEGSGVAVFENRCRWALAAFARQSAHSRVPRQT
jgi:phenylpropionate dioxygenase-like ring-hydroxylating dioxygenase large terminal subunit